VARLDGLDRDFHTLRQISTVVEVVSFIAIYVLFTVLALIPSVAAAWAAPVYHLTKKQEQDAQQNATWSLEAIGLLKTRLPRLAAVITIFVTIPGAILLLAYTLVDKCGVVHHYRVLRWGFITQQLLCLVRVAVDGLLDVREDGAVWATWACALLSIMFQIIASTGLLCCFRKVRGTQEGRGARIDSLVERVVIK